MNKDQYSNNPDLSPGLEKDFYLMKCNKNHLHSKTVTMFLSQHKDNLS